MRFNPCPPSAIRTSTIKRTLLLGVLLLTSLALHAQSPVLTATQKLNPEELSQLLAPIALYPDALIALILPASTVPSDVVLGARFVQANGNPDLADSQPWDESVKSLVRYPDVIGWMDQNLEWTASVGEAFVDQPADVMNSIQGLRAQAKAAGNLQDTPQQRVVVEEKIIRIIPADPEIIYVPRYDPEIIFVQSYAPDPLLTFGLGFAVGAWLNYDFDWNRQSVYRGNWRGWNDNWSGGSNGNWNNGGGNNDQVNVVNINNATQWQPSANGQRQINQRQRNNNGNARYVAARENAINSVALASGDQTVRPSSVQQAVALPRPTRIGNERRNDRQQDNAAPQPTVTTAFPGTASETPESPRGKTKQQDKTQKPTAENQLPGPSQTSAQPATPADHSALPDRPVERKNRPQATAPTAPPQVPGQLAQPSQPGKQPKTPRSADGTRQNSNSEDAVPPSDLPAAGGKKKAKPGDVPPSPSNVLPGKSTVASPEPATRPQRPQKQAPPATGNQKIKQPASANPPEGATQPSQVRPQQPAQPQRPAPQTEAPQRQQQTKQKVTPQQPAPESPQTPQKQPGVQRQEKRVDNQAQAASPAAPPNPQPEAAPAPEKKKKDSD